MAMVKKGSQKQINPIHRKMEGLKRETYCARGSNSKLECEETPDKEGPRSEPTKIGGKKEDYENPRKEPTRIAADEKGPRT